MFGGAKRPMETKLMVNFPLTEQPGVLDCNTIKNFTPAPTASPPSFASVDPR